MIEDPDPEALDAYELDDPKHPQYTPTLLDRTEE